MVFLPKTTILMMAIMAGGAIMAAGQEDVEVVFPDREDEDVENEVLFPDDEDVKVEVDVDVELELVPQDYSHLLEDHWPQGKLNCAHGFRKFDPLLQKRTYYVGVHAPSGLDVARKEFNLTFEEYLDRSVGDRFIPPINFKMKPSVDPLLDWVSSVRLIVFSSSCLLVSAPNLLYRWTTRRKWTLCMRIQVSILALE
jgi:hypothetical protein